MGVWALVLFAKGYTLHFEGAKPGFQRYGRPFLVLCGTGGISFGSFVLWNVVVYGRFL
jgi:hypothetical protein